VHRAYTAGCLSAPPFALGVVRQIYKNEISDCLLLSVRDSAVMVLFMQIQKI